MSRKVVRLTLDHLAQLDEDLSAPCRTCLFWQLDPVSRDRVADEEAADGEGGVGLPGAARVGLARRADGERPAEGAL